MQTAEFSDIQDVQVAISGDFGSNVAQVYLGLRDMVLRKHYKHILVPLDGSKLAESALPDAFALARLSQAQVTALQVIVPIAHDLDPDVDDPDFIEQQGDKYCALARKYLKGVCERVGCENITVHAEAKMGPPAETIIDYVHQQPIDLVAMATHGRSGLKRWVYGSVADKVLCRANVPVLLVRAHLKQEAV